MMRTSHTRRELLTRGGVAALVLAPLSSCNFLSTDPDGDAPSAANGRDKGPEAPSLARLVEADELAPVESRLPAEPLVVEPVDEIGTYGHEWQTAVISTDPGGWVSRLARYDNLLRWSDDLRPEPNLAVSWEIEDDGRRYTFVLREGVRWSDGEPFTTGDIQFAYDDILSTPALYPTVPDWLLAGAHAPQLEVIDELVFSFVFAEPKALLPEYLASPLSHILIASPRHQLERFHAAYASDAEELAVDEGFSAWTELFFAKADWEQTPALPTMCAWILTQTLGPGGRVVVERNPFYWKTDPDGSQLPYIDRIVATVANDLEAAVLGVSNGEYTLPFYEATSLEHKPVLARHRETNGYHFVDVGEDNANEVMISLNLTHENPVLREVFGNRDFRIGLSYAINRQEIIEAVFQRQGEPWQVAPLPESYAYDEEMAKQYTDYDVDRASEYLDRSFPGRDADGFRLGPDGERIRFSVDVPVEQPDWVNCLELIVEHWRAVGVHADVNNVASSLFTERTLANAHDASANHAEGGLDPIFDARSFVPVTTGATYGMKWVDWYLSGGDEGEEPPSSVRRQLELYDEVTRTVEVEQQRKLFGEILDIAKEEFLTIGITPIVAGYTVVQDRFRNVPERMTLAWVYAGIFPYRAEQYFVTQGADG